MNQAATFMFHMQHISSVLTAFAIGKFSKTLVSHKDSPRSATDERPREEIVPSVV